jgi:hypothetical protein
MLFDDKEVDSRWSNDNFHTRVEFCAIDCLNECLGAGKQPICLNCKLLLEIEGYGEVTHFEILETGCIRTYRGQ